MTDTSPFSHLSEISDPGLQCNVVWCILISSKGSVEITYTKNAGLQP